MEGSGDILDHPCHKVNKNNDVRRNLLDHPCHKVNKNNDINSTYKPIAARPIGSSMS